MKSVSRTVKFPENKKIGAQLDRGDMVIIAEYAGLKPGSIRDMMNGFRKITFKTGQAIIRFFQERENVTRTLEEIKSL